ncbi:hypothetical protein [Herbaspirillum sp.]|uniref:hypothetical protein n=1 Tax=Herbaspirillum TaxID=963 RepID=UPI0025839CFB|nr:hypothetical protein [Herbaspirillum sp.]MCP3655817.1 hypothetical protein [Herbaspirillum sp.]MCP3948004.1 hypothetical protein [Herbaspirillum sp.]MCP4030645.1 hypothetical protein [Herbaspirillum sp.]MCP4557482.1 hypothetical protein [Herbaspirillum sp.]
MEMGSDLSVDDAEQDYKEACADVIATKAAELVASRDMERSEAIETALEELRQDIEADGDSTRTLETMIRTFEPSKKVPRAQVAAIKLELMDDARDAAETL